MAYLREVSSCPWYQFLDMLWIVGPVPLLLAACGAVIVAFRDRRNAAMCALLVTGTFVLFFAVFPLMQNLRYLSPSNGAFCLLAGIGFCYLMSLAQGRLSVAGYNSVVAVSIVVVMIALVRDYGTFHSVVVQRGVLDLAVKMIRQYR